MSNSLDPGIPSECQTVCIQIRPDILSGLIWVQTVCKGYQQTTLVTKELRLSNVCVGWKVFNLTAISEKWKKLTTVDGDIFFVISFKLIEHASGAIRTACDIQIDGRRGAGRPKLTWKKLTERDYSEWKLTTVDPQERITWRSGVRSAMRAASQLPGKGPLMWMMPLHLHVNQKSDYDYDDMIMAIVVILKGCRANFL